MACAIRVYHLSLVALFCSLQVCFSYIQPPERAAKWNRCNKLSFFVNVTLAICCFFCKMQFLWIFCTVLLTHKLLPRTIITFFVTHQYLIKDSYQLMPCIHMSHIVTFIFHFLLNFLELSFAWFRTLHNASGSSVFIINTML